MLEFSDLKIVHYLCALKILCFSFICAFFILMTKVHELMRLSFAFG